MDDMLVKRAYALDSSEIYGKYVLINTDYLKSVEEELVNSDMYLPVLVRRYLSYDYRSYLKNNNDTEVIRQVIESRNLSDKDEVEELIDWIEKNNYLKLFNQENYIKLQKDLKELDKEYNELELW